MSDAIFIAYKKGFNVSSLVIISYVATGLVSMIFAVILAHLARQKADVKLSRKDQYRHHTPEDVKGYESLYREVCEEIKEIAGADGKTEKISKQVVDVLDKELKKRTGVVAQEFSKKYDAIISEKEKEKELAWSKYSKISETKKTTEAVLRSLSEGLVVVDTKGKVIMMNPAAEKLLDSKQKERLNKPITSGLKEEHLISFVKGSDEKGDREIELFSKEDQTRKTIRSSSAIIENEYGQTVGMVSVLSDITKQKELDAMKSNFVSNITHELRTPLVATQKSLALLLTRSTGAITDVQERFLIAADQNLKRLSALIDDLLDLAKFESGKMELKHRTIMIENIVDESISSFSAWAGTRSINLEKRIEDKLPDVSADPGRMVQVLNNLIGNAIKYTPENGSIIIEVVLNKKDNCLQCSIIDTGIGIPEKDFPKVFDKFYQAGERSLSDVTGTGIGLSVAKEIVASHGGKIWVESEIGQGTRFIFTMPVLDNTNTGG